MNTTLFLVSIPRKEDKEKQISVEDYLKNVEQFFSSLSGMKSKNILEASPLFVFEIAVHRIGEEIYFYFACPRSFSQIMEKQILSFWPRAEILPAEDYNIFNPSGESLGSEAILKHSPILPIKSYEEFKTDPISSITNVLTKLEKDGEGGAVQIVFKPSNKNIKNKGIKAVKLIQEGNKIKTAISKANLGLFSEITEAISQRPNKSAKEEESKKLSPVEEQVISAISKKYSEPMFDINLRIVSSAKNIQRAESILNQIKESFEQFNSPILNGIKFNKLSKKRLKKLFYYFSFRLFNEKRIMTLSSGEMAGIFHFPMSGLFTPHIKWLKSKQSPPPVNLPEEGVIIGKSIFRGEEKLVRMSEKDRGRHLYMIGQTGTGKSGLLQNLIVQDIENGKGAALIDPHGDLAEEIISIIPNERANDIIYFNPTDIDYPIGLNMLEFDPKYPEAKTFVANEVIEIFEKLYNLKAQGFGGPIFEQYMRNSLLLAMEDPSSGSTLVEIPRILADVSFRKYKLSQCKNVIVKNFWELEAEKAGGEAALANMVPYITSKMNVFIANDIVRPIISQQKSSINFRELMDEGKILIVNLSKGKLGESNSYLLGMIIVGRILLAAFSRADIPEEKRRDFNLYIDEFQNVTTSTITSILAEARKYHLNMVFAHQFIGQLDEKTIKAIFGNVGSMIAFRVGPDDGKYLISEFEPIFSESDLVNLDNFNAALRLLINGETSEPFNMITLPPKKGTPEISSIIKNISRKKYGRNRTLVEAELYERLKRTS